MPPHKSEKIQLPSCNYLISSLTYALSRRRVRKGGGGEEEQQGAPESPHDADDDLLLRELQLNPPRSNLLRGPLVTDDKSDDHEHRVFPTGRTPAGSWHRGGRATLPIAERIQQHSPPPPARDAADHDSRTRFEF